MSTPVWINEPAILLKHDKLNEFWPDGKMSVEEKINAITRLVILLSCLGYLFTFSLKILFAGIITLGVVVLLFFIQNKTSFKMKELFSNKQEGVFPDYTNPKVYEMNKDKYIKPTIKNPLMNVLLPEIKYDPKRKPAAPSFNPTVEKEINNAVKDFIEKPFNDKNIDKKLFADIGDELEFNRSMINFSSTANTTIPSDQKGYLNFLYGSLKPGQAGSEELIVVKPLHYDSSHYINTN